MSLRDVDRTTPGRAEPSAFPGWSWSCIALCLASSRAAWAALGARRGARTHDGRTTPGRDCRRRRPLGETRTGQLFGEVSIVPVWIWWLSSAVIVEALVQVEFGGVVQGDIGPEQRVSRRRSCAVINADQSASVSTLSTRRVSTRTSTDCRGRAWRFLGFRGRGGEFGVAAVVDRAVGGFPLLDDLQTAPSVSEFRERTTGGRP
jgi:hypothetical protein